MSDFEKHFIDVDHLFEGQSITTSQSDLESTIDLHEYAPQGVFSVQVDLSGACSVNLEYSVSNDGVNYVDKGVGVDNQGTTIPSFTAGVGHYSFRLEPCAFLKLRPVETGSGAGTINKISFLKQ